ncbi:T9SS C-terminal target domain-containing protein [Nibrella saemangeumensis]|uniref:T9SS C-terminal target domain-containing protein n=1 Tax=Nibrella saemangeumensis TaxID=1084526 RepID=A0ABP8MXH7_9BACT
MYFTILHKQIFGLLLALVLIGGWTTAVQAQVLDPLPGGVTVRGKFCIPVDEECKTDSLTFSDTTRNGARIQWAFEDPAGGQSRFVNGSIAKQIYTQPGIYTIYLKRDTTASSLPIPIRVNIGVPPPPFQGWRPDTTICQGETIDLNPYPNRTASQYQYLWYPKGDTTQVLKVDSSGCYSVEVRDPETGCTTQDRINVDVCGEQKQAQGVKWYFGGNAGLDFGSGGATPIEDAKLNTIEGSSSIANTKGELLFYSDGLTIFDKNGDRMPSVVFDLNGKPQLVQNDTTRLGGNQLSTQSALIVPKPTCRGCEYLYYVYTTAEINGTQQLTYSIVDMRYNNGKGAVVEKNIPLVEQSTERSASVKNERDSTYWVITHDYGTNRFRVYHLTESDTKEEKIYDLGQAHDTPIRGEGYMKIGPADTSGNGDRPMAVVIPGPPTNSIDLFTFNDSTGTLTFNRTIPLGPAPPKAYGVEFSPDGTKLYVSMLGDSANNNMSYLLSYDLTQTDSASFAESRVVIDSSSTRQYGALQIAPDGKIYVAIKGSNTLGVIENPDGGSLLDSLRFNPRGQSLGGKTSQLGLPNLVANFNDQSSGPGISYADTCAGSPTTFEIGPNCPKLKETYTLTFGDGSAPLSFTSAQPKTHTYQKAGVYPISLRIVTEKATGGICKDTLIRDTVTIVDPPPKIELGPDIDSCRISVTLDAKVQAAAYYWIFNRRVIGRTKQLTATRTGQYVIVAANGECFETDTIQVVLRRPPSLDLGPDTTFCQGTSYNLTVPQQTWTKFQWSNGTTQRDNPVTQPGTYFVKAQNNLGCENSDTINLRQLPKPVLAATLKGPTTCTAVDGSIEVQPTPAGSYTYVWSQASGAALPSTTNRQTDLAEGGYRVNATNENACSVDTSFTLNSPVNQLRVASQPTAALCSQPNSGSIALTITGSTPSTYIWLDAGGNQISQNPILSGALPGIYSVEVTDVGGCKATANNIRVGLDSTGFASLGPDRRICVGDTAVLIPIDGGGQAGNTYQWSTGANGRSVVVNAPGSYSIVVRNTITGCVGRSTVQVTNKPQPEFSLTKEANLCVPDNGVAQLTAGGAAGLRFYWPQLQDSSRTVTVRQVGTYQLQVTNPDGCTATDAAQVLDLCDPRVVTPEAFTPNGDGVNDAFSVFTAYITDFDLKIFNRWGEVIFHSDDPEKRWDGTYRGALYPSMLYAYVISFKSQYFPERPKEVKRGSVLLIR